LFKALGQRHRKPIMILEHVYAKFCSEVASSLDPIQGNCLWTGKFHKIMINDQPSATLPCNACRSTVADGITFWCRCGTEFCMIKIRWPKIARWQNPFVQALGKLTQKYQNRNCTLDQTKELMNSMRVTPMMAHIYLLYTWHDPKLVALPALLAKSKIEYWTTAPAIIWAKDFPRW